MDKREAHPSDNDGAGSNDHAHASRHPSFAPDDSEQHAARWADAMRGADDQAAATAHMEMYDRYYRPLVTFGKRTYRLSDDAAADVAQDVFAEIWNRRKDWPVHHGVARYLFRAMANRSANQRRNDARRNARHDDAVGKDEPAIQNAGEAAIDAAELASAIVAILDAMPTRERRILLLRKWEERSMQAIEQIMGLSENTVRRSLVRAVATLHTELALRGWDHILLRLRHHQTTHRNGHPVGHEHAPDATIRTADGATQRGGDGT
jgi:RNA polymerase sigma-70 factor, ECF subfamily